MQLTETIDTLVKDVKIPFAVERRNSSGQSEQLEIVFDTAIVYLQLYKLTRDKKILERVIPYLISHAKTDRGFSRWQYTAPRSQPGIPPFPPDADSTALSLLLFAYAEQEGIDVPDQFKPRNNLEQFKELIDQEEGIKTWFGPYQPLGEIDPVVNSAVALLYITLGLQDKVSEHVKRYLNRYAVRIETKPKNTTYYPAGTYYLASRIEEINSYEPGYLEPQAVLALDNFLKSVDPTTCIEASWLSRAASYRKDDTTAQKHNAFLCERRQQDGLWPWEIFYNQKTVWYYGHRNITSLFAIEALEATK